MQIVETMKIKSKVMGTENIFQKVDGASFCKSCGKKHEEKENSGSCECKSIDFIKGNFAAILAGYLRLEKEGTLKKYYDIRYRKDSAIRMNNGRMIISLLIRDGLMIPGDRKTEDIVRKILVHAGKTMG